MLLVARLLGALPLLARGEMFALLPLLITAWMAWNLYSGWLWIRNLIALYGLYVCLQSLFWLFGGALIGQPLLMVAALFNIAVFAGTIYLLFAYEPVQDYFRYVGGQTL
ncbi:hypothetical protein [Deinococcus sp. Marseille-Q6407]|uniref:hypothetical protein n=1 Tax=Deinococcus sp. Marseille-Q6407 TaxID=2969223 RepID=UPI0021C01904|nr:hypothetical protein [Deinococcus sp. Marseille-Q6407]